MAKSKTIEPKEMDGKEWKSEQDDTIWHEGQKVHFLSLLHRLWNRTIGRQPSGQWLRTRCFRNRDEIPTNDSAWLQKQLHYLGDDEDEQSDSDGNDDQ